MSSLLWACQKSDVNRGNSRLIDSILLHNNRRLQSTSGVCIGNSIVAGHPWRRSGLELGILNYPDSFGQISYHLAQLTRFKWIDHGWGGQTTYEIRNRFMRDAVGDTSDPGDGRGSVTLASRPNYAVIEGGINDIAFGDSLSAIESNLAWMASVCKQNNIRCIVLNCIGSAYGLDNTQIQMISDLNKWLASGVLDSVQATIVNINSLWNSGSYGGISSYGNDNIHFSSLVFQDDGVHFTRAGYDSVAHAIFRVANLMSYDSLAF